MKEYTLWACLLASAFLGACSDEDDAKDAEPPRIVENEAGSGNPSNPIDCQVYHLGDTIYFNYEFTDNQELGNFSLNIHHNFDHHNHPNMNVTCQLDPTKKANANVWVFNQNYPIPQGLKVYDAKESIAIPRDIQTGDYHFMIVLTDKTGWQAPQRGISIKIIE